jgi:hypothetical protein
MMTQESTGILRELQPKGVAHQRFGFSRTQPGARHRLCSTRLLGAIGFSIADKIEWQAGFNILDGCGGVFE